jgi:TonB family protein
MYAELINYAIRSTACLAFFYVFYAIILRNETCFSFNRGYLLITLALSFILPMLSISIAFPSNSPIDPNAFILPEIIISGTAIEQAGQVYNIFSILNILYFLGAVFLVVRLSYRMYQLWIIINSNRHLRENKYTYQVIPTNGKLPTSSFLNYLFWDNTLSINESEKHQIIDHERVHIMERHTYDILLIEFLSILFWFNPIVWLWRKAISENHEYLADAKASNGVEDYAEFLAKHTLALNGLEVIHPFKSSEVIKRLKMLKKYGQKTNLVKLLAVVPLLIFMIFTMSFSIEEVLEHQIQPLIINQDLNVLQRDEVSSTPIPKPEYNNDKHLLDVEIKSKVLLPNKVNPKGIDFSNEIQTVDVSIKEEKVFMIVEESATPRSGDMTEFYKYISKNMKYPKKARKLGIEGQIFVEFVVDKSGNLTNIKAIKGIGGGCDAEAVRVISNASSWKPGRQHGKAVKQKIVLPITFKLG